MVKFNDLYWDGATSLYTGGYRFMRRYTENLARCLISQLKLATSDTFLDYGCARGFLVMVLREYGISAYGMDISPEAIEHARSQLKLTELQLSTPWHKDLPAEYSWIMAKDVLEHLQEEELEDWLRVVYPRASKGVLISVPLGEDGEFVIPASRRDLTHVLCYPPAWWMRKFERAGFHPHQLKKFPGLTDKYGTAYPNGQGIFILHSGSSEVLAA